MKKIAIFIFAALCFASCDNDDNPVVSTNYVTIDPIVMGNADVSFAANDRIGLRSPATTGWYTRETVL